MAYRPQVNLKNINGSISSLNESVSSARTSAKNIGQTILDTNRKKRKTISSSISSFRKRREAVQRKEREDIVEASTIGGAIQSSRTAAINSTKGFLGRILDFIGTLLVGWAISNLPSIIKMAEDLMKRMQTYFAVLNDFKNGLQEFLVTFGDTVVGISGSLINFDFVSTKRILDDNMKKMQNSLVKMDNSLTQAFGLLRDDVYKMLGIEKPTPGGEDGGGGGDIPPDTGSPGGNDTGRARTGTKEQRALLDTLAMAEGTYRSGYSTWLGHRKHGPENLTNLTIDEIHDLQGSFLRKFGAPSAAVGRYQFVPLREHARRFGANTATQRFSPEFQDRLALFLAANRGVNTKEPIDSSDVLKLGREWASVPGGGYGQDRYTVRQVLDMYNSLYKTVRMTPKAPPPAATKINTVQTKGGADDPVKITYPDGTTDVIKPGTKIGALPQEGPKFASTRASYSTELAMALRTGKKRKTDIIVLNNQVEVEKPVFFPLGGGSKSPEIDLAYSSVNSRNQNLSRMV